MPPVPPSTGVNTKINGLSGIESNIFNGQTFAVSQGAPDQCRLTQATNSRTCCCNCVEKGPHIRLADHIPRSSTAGGEGRAAGAGAGIQSGTFDPNRLSSGSMFFPYLHTS